MYGGEDDTDEFECKLLDMPNWSFSYALALFRIHQKDPSNEDAKNSAHKAIQTALFRFPTVVGQLLAKNEVNTTSRSFQTDWPSVLEFVNELIRKFQNSATECVKSDRTIREHCIPAYENIVQIFVQQNFSLWSPPVVLKWVYDNLQILKDTNVLESTSLSPAIIRYASCSPSDFADKFQTMPAEANPFNPNAVAHALTIDLRRPRLIQRGARGT